jgi:polar amino acid transport system permease protein
VQIDWSVVVQYKGLFVWGLFVTLGLTVASALIGGVLGLFLGLLRVSHRSWLVYPARAYVTVFRGTPLLLQLLIVHFALLPTLFADIFHVTPPAAITSGVVALSLHAAAYIAEIFRAGIQAVAKGQLEAAYALGMRYSQALYHVVLPQAVRYMLPPLFNELIALLKDSSLVAVIAVNDLTYAAFTTAKNTFERWAPYLTAGVLYLFLTLLLTQIVGYFERRYDLISGRCARLD